MPRPAGCRLQDAARVFSGVLPYKMQDAYSRTVRKRRFSAAVLENDALCATFLPELGGRLFALYDKRRGRDILYRNSAIRYGNLALCNAWFAGGAEWNIGIKGHSPLTNRPLFAARAEVCLRTGEPSVVTETYPTWARPLQENGRLRMYMGQALVACGAYRAALAYINPNLCVPDIREGEYAISRIYLSLWRGILRTEEGREATDEEILAAHPLPSQLDFRMHG